MKIIEYANRPLTEQRYSQTEREMLAVVWGREHFNLYLYGANFKVLTLIGIGIDWYCQAHFPRNSSP